MMWPLMVEKMYWFFDLYHHPRIGDDDYTEDSQKHLVVGEESVVVFLWLAVYSIDAGGDDIDY
jgi:hypothetical protein